MSAELLPQDLSRLVRQSLRLSEEAPTAPLRSGHRAIASSLVIALANAIAMSSNGSSFEELGRTMAHHVLDMGDRP